MFNLLTVCVGNICRSPMAEALLAAAIKERGLQINVASAGIGALVGHEADPMAQELMTARGLDISEHRARQLDIDLCAGTDLVLVMETWHQQEIEAEFPFARGRVHRIGRWSDIEVVDPYQQEREMFEESLASIEQGVDDWMTRLERLALIF